MPRYEALAEQPQGPQAKALVCEKSPMNKGKEIVFKNCMVPESECNTYRKTLINSSGLYKEPEGLPDSDLSESLETQAVSGGGEGGLEVKESFK